jgi:galactose-1-phosphate uridylyltransferase
MYSGFELGSGIYLNMIYPEEAARFLREAVGRESKEENGRR